MIFLNQIHLECTKQAFLYQAKSLALSICVKFYNGIYKILLPE